MEEEDVDNDGREDAADDAVLCQHSRRCKRSCSCTEADEG